MTEELKKGEWNKDDMCAKLIKENSDIIVKLSEKLEKEVLEMFLNSEEVNLFLEETDKKKLANSVTASVDRMLLEDKGKIYPLFAYDERFPGGVNEEDLYEKEERKAVNKDSQSQFMKTFKSNLKDTALQFLTHGPGKTNFNIFRNTLDSILNGMISNRFIETFGKIYNADNKLRLTFDTIMSNLTSGKDAKTISSEILKIARSIVPESLKKEEKKEKEEKNLSIHEARAEDAKNLSDGSLGVAPASKINTKKSFLLAASIENINMFMAIANFIAIIMKYYQNLILTELDNKSIKAFNEANLSNGIKQLNSDILTCAKNYDLNDDKVECFAKKYINYVETKPDPIGPLLVLIYTAITIFNSYRSVGIGTKSNQKANELMEALNRKFESQKEDIKVKDVDEINRIITVTKENKTYKMKLDALVDLNKLEAIGTDNIMNLMLSINSKALPTWTTYDAIAEILKEVLENPNNFKELFK